MVNGQTYTLSGTYEFLDTINCVLEILNLALTNSISEELSNKLSIYPNPTSGNVIISFPMNAEGNLSVFDTQGKLVLSSTLNSGDIIDLSNKTPGVYTFKINLNDKIHIERIIKN